ncbi:ASF1 like histone chaperone [Nitzschia inconspicua]|uniref:ASF1 like histone chaperone n=1 Tax=Nitzschia inconspicua TaxID=303405 RepID=A0A9K3KP34_9STRA|nr:ASF1 like histone chaperone [Nitzschia inconspicua]
MALVNVVNMVVLDNPTTFTSPFQFEITFECLQELDDDLEWKVLYVGSAQDASRDQILDEILVGPVPVGVNKFVLQADAPDPSKLAPEDLLGVTVVLVTCSYKEREFVRVGYYVNNEYHDPDAPPPPPPPTDGSEPPPPPPLPNPVPLEHIQRQILADKPRVTKFPISWGDETTNENNSMTVVGAQSPTPMLRSGVEMNHGGSAVPSAVAAATGAPPVGLYTANTVTPPGPFSLPSQQESSGVVFMQEESNLEHSHFGGSGGGGGGVQTMTE